MLEEITNVWRYLSDNNVKYLTIGGFAVNIYGYGRNTGDIDIYIEDTLENRENLRKAIAQMGLGDYESILTMDFVPGWTDFTLNYNFRLDVMTAVKGLENISFADLFAQATIIDLGGVSVYFIDYEHLIKAKKATSRLKDLLDIEELRKMNPDKVD
jgi:predicted nucleotidyltransferase